MRRLVEGAIMARGVSRMLRLDAPEAMRVACDCSRGSQLRCRAYRRAAQQSQARTTLAGFGQIAIRLETATKLCA
ncbi:MAG: hypothetical protein JJ920_08790 [Roseitalea sp.]|jgi:hypothetical protein|nr:hypothetical protein [Roseitalea sp.]MBO6742994.1 hypothetical protein [Roseitalea sp.]